MEDHHCPGPDRKKAAAPEELECPKCGADVELWTDESETTCPSCKAKLTRAELEAND